MENIFDCDIYKKTFVKGMQGSRILTHPHIEKLQNRLTKLSIKDIMILEKKFIPYIKEFKKHFSDIPSYSKNLTEKNLRFFYHNIQICHYVLIVKDIKKRKLKTIMELS